MKKIILLFFFIFLLAGCYDNIELSDIAIINAIGIDYDNNNYIVTYEVLSDDLENKLSYTTKGEGKKLVEAFTSANYKVAKEPFFSHLKLVILSENAINDKLEEITNYLFSNNSIRNEFFMIVTDKSPEVILSHNDELEPVASTFIMNLLNTEKYNNSLVTNDNFEKIISKLYSNKQDIILNSITIKDNEISLNNSYIFNKYNFKNKLTDEESSLYNLLTRNTYSNIFTINNTSIKVDNSAVNIDISNNNLFINAFIEAEIIENNANIDLNHDYEQLIENNLVNFIKKLQTSKSDILGFQDKYYKKYNKSNHNLWEYADINTEIKVNIKENNIHEVNINEE